MGDPQEGTYEGESHKEGGAWGVIHEGGPMMGDPCGGTNKEKFKSCFLYFPLWNCLKLT